MEVGEGGGGGGECRPAARGKRRNDRKRWRGLDRGRQRGTRKEEKSIAG